MKRPLLFWSSVWLAFTGAIGCAWLTPSHVADVATIATCILSHDGDPAAMIAQECAIADVKQIADILAAHRAAMVRADACPPPSSNPGY